ncbi:response regulator receiver domain [Pseudoalteromonas sp. A757]|uniref:response regulator receiver domain n=1 Tax=Pseudoalteromonas sp. A757 TaxID=2250709 RepID=UPI000FFE361A|nr:response regulator receiver domain [Pseudoalteromonas sp. A757]RXE86242.1 hypothetical protein DRB05_12540 [Pseudoalteromonas sp. A757]
MTEQYQTKVVEAFRDNAIRSVLLIDDEYHSYQSAINNKKDISEKIQQIQEKYADSSFDDVQQKLQELFDLTSDIQRSDVASEFVSFFHEKKLICDVESNTENLEHDKIRKSDLIILDYFLSADGNRAESSLKLLHELSSSPHMNVVVVYTGEPTENVWLEIAATLRGSSYSPEKALCQPNLKESWDLESDEWWDQWKLFFDVPTIHKYLLGTMTIEAITNNFTEQCEKQEIELPKGEHIQQLIEKSLENWNKNKFPHSNLDIHGETPLWLQAGNIFIAICSKDDKTTPNGVWNCIEQALVNWKPSFYRVITSELQNHIEEANLSMEKSLSISVEEQMAFLWGILQAPDDHKSRISRELLGNVAFEALEHILYKSNLIESVINTSSALSPPDYVARNKDNEEKHKSFQNEILELSYVNTNKYQPTEMELKYKIAHAFNEKLSTTKHFHRYITTGSILRDENNSWYVCVTPSCNTVPMQCTDQATKDLAPHRQLTLAKLKKIDNFQDALHEAHLSSFIFVTSPDKEALAFSVVNLNSKLPNLVKVVILDHDSESWTNGDHKEFISLKINRNRTHNNCPQLKEVKKKIYPIALLKPAYAARFQNIQSHYEGRIGVDFATLNISGSEPE